MLILLGENISRISIQAKPHFVAARSIEVRLIRLSNIFNLFSATTMVFPGVIEKLPMHHLTY